MDATSSIEFVFVDIGWPSFPVAYHQLKTGAPCSDHGILFHGPYGVNPGTGVFHYITLLGVVRECCQLWRGVHAPDDSPFEVLTTICANANKQYTSSTAIAAICVAPLGLYAYPLTLGWISKHNID